MGIKPHYSHISNEYNRQGTPHLLEISPRKKHVEIPITTDRRVEREMRNGIVQKPTSPFTVPSKVVVLQPVLCVENTDM
jgi:hypothetical protein